MIHISNNSAPSSLSVKPVHHRVCAQNAKSSSEGAVAHACTLPHGKRVRAQPRTSRLTPLGNVMGCPCSSAQKLPDAVNPPSAPGTLISLPTKTLRQAERLCAESAAPQRVPLGRNPALPSHSLTLPAGCRQIGSDVLHLRSWRAPLLVFIQF